ncbi:MAG: hypothetical protein LLG05_00475 [Porphyromonadaceae bacterium]|nr:hypothetical protein [Porphyromonadaceae bacterium]
MSATQDAVFQFGLGETVKLPVTASTKIYKGSMVSYVNGNAKNLADGEKFVGHATELSDNTSGLAGAKTVSVIRGEFGRYKLQVSVPNANSLMIGAYIYAVDENTYTLAPMRTPVGKIVQYISSGVVLVEFDVNLSRERMTANGVFLPFRTAPACAADAKLGTQFIHTVVDGGSDAAHYVKVVNASRGEHYNAGIVIHTNDAANDGSNIQLNGAPFYLDSTSKPAFFGARIKVSDATNGKLFLGLAVVDTTLNAACSDDISFRKADASTDVKLYVEKSNTETVSGAAEVVAADDTYMNLGFVYDGTNVIPYVNGAAGTKLAVTNLPNNARLTPSLELLSTSTTTKDVTVAFLDAYQLV